MQGVENSVGAVRLSSGILRFFFKSEKLSESIMFGKSIVV